MYIDYNLPYNIYSHLLGGDYMTDCIAYATYELDKLGAVT